LFHGFGSQKINATQIIDYYRANRKKNSKRTMMVAE